ncbi:MAG: restriction endonuclease subunit S, partial [Nevskia sp.]|nr:restriction endonuclease subunit S [Nevskia sp.]
MASEAPAALDKGWLYHPNYPDDWERRPLYSLAQWVNGLAFRDIQFSASGMPVIKIAEIKGGISGQTKFTEQTFDDSVRVKPGDLLFSWSGQPETSIDAFWWRGPEGWLNQHVFRVTPGDGIEPTFFYYLLRYLKPNFVGIARNKQTTGLGHVTRRDLESIEAAYPELPEQRAIAHILGTLDDKIELNRRMSETLEAMARALFKSWFVDFDPVRAKAEGRDPGLPKPLADLFPARLVDSELGEIPEGWEGGSVYEIADVIYGAPFSSAQFNTGGIGEPLIRIRDLPTESPSVWTPEKHPKGYKVRPGDVVVGMDGEFRAYLWGGAEGWLNQRTCVFKPKSGVSAAFVRNAIMQPLSDVESTETATTVIHLGKADIDRFKLVMPSPALRKHFDGICQPWYDRIVAAKQETR